MKLATRKLNEIATNPWFIILAGIASIGGFIWFLYDKITATSSLQQNLVSKIFLYSSIVVLVVGYIYSIKVRNENISLRRIAETFCHINNIYRDTLRELFHGDTPITNPTDLLNKEEETLKSVCQRIEKIFSRVINRDCLVTIKLLTKEDNGRIFANTYVRSTSNCERDKEDSNKYLVDVKKNTGFYSAMQKRSDGRPPHFYSGNLEREKDYCNERQHYTRYYKSALVVPIMGINKDQEGTSDEHDLIGYLCVDTLSKNRLNNGYHLYMISSLASQMYNFISLMRGKYTVLVG